MSTYPCVLERPEEALKYWQKHLKLMDWDIHIETDCTPDEMDLPDSKGTVSYTESLKCAIIKILDPRLYTNLHFMYDPDETLVHELLHLKFSLLDSGENTMQDRVVHCLINDLAEAIIHTNHESEEIK